MSYADTTKSTVVDSFISNVNSILNKAGIKDRVEKDEDNLLYYVIIPDSISIDDLYKIRRIASVTKSFKGVESVRHDIVYIFSKN